MQQKPSAPQANAPLQTFSEEETPAKAIIKKPFLKRGTGKAAGNKNVLPNKKPETNSRQQPDHRNGNSMDEFEQLELACASRNNFNKSGRKIAS